MWFGLNVDSIQIGDLSRVVSLGKLSRCCRGSLPASATTAAASGWHPKRLAPACSFSTNSSLSLHFQISLSKSFDLVWLLVARSMSVGERISRGRGWLGSFAAPSRLRLVLLWQRRLCSCSLSRHWQSLWSGRVKALCLVLVISDNA
jgi:hypothetical protein